MGKGEGSGSGAGTGAGDGCGDGAGAYRGKTERIAVPAMPMPMAVLCCILNFIIPGFGTILAGFTSFCCSRNEDISMEDRWVSCLANLGIGCAQLFSTLLFFIGWIWSIAWGIFFIGMSSEYYHRNRAGDIDGTRGVVISTQPGVVTLTPGRLQTGHGAHVTFVRQPVGPQFGPPVLNAGGTTVLATTNLSQYPTNQAYPGDTAPPPYPGPPVYPQQQQYEAPPAYTEHHHGYPPQKQ